MDTIQSDDALRVWIVNHLAKELWQHAILKGGMVLRLLDCPRYTNDLGYIFVPFQSKKEIVAPILAVLEELPGVTVQHRLHPTNAQFDVVLRNPSGSFKTQIEVNVSESCESQSLTTGSFARQHGQHPHLVKVMRFDIMLAHKLAAWNERRLMRDLYDAYFIYKNLNVLPNVDILQSRLKAVRYARRVTDKTLPKQMSLEDFCNLLQAELKLLTGEMLEDELRDFLDVHQLSGLDAKIRIALTEMTERLHL